MRIEHQSGPAGAETAKNISHFVDGDLVVAQPFHFGLYEHRRVLLLAGHAFCTDQTAGKVNQRRRKIVQDLIELFHRDTSCWAVLPPYCFGLYHYIRRKSSPQKCRKCTHCFVDNC